MRAGGEFQPACWRTRLRNHHQGIIVNLPKPEITCCFFERAFEPPLAAMVLDWDADSFGVGEHVWRLPERVLVKGPAPRRFGVAIRRHGKDSYQVRVLWNQLCLKWEGLTRLQIMASSLAIILQALGTDLWYLLNQAEETTDLTQAA
jgi:hypothetical protein